MVCCTRLNKAAEQISEPELTRLSVFQRPFLRLQFPVSQNRLDVLAGVRQFFWDGRFGILDQLLLSPSAAR